MPNQDFSYYTDVLGQITGKENLKQTAPIVFLDSQRSLTDISRVHVDLCAILAGIVDFRLQKRLKCSLKLTLIKNLLKTKGNVGKLTVYPFISIRGSYSF